MSHRKQLVETYIDGFRHSDHERILACLTDDVVWDLPGHTYLTGKAAFDAEIENEEFTGSPTLVVDQLVEEGDTVVAMGSGAGTHKLNGPFRFRFCDAFVFSGERISRVVSYVVPLP
jgi:ketosteroid isomerase-like protein